MTGVTQASRWVHEAAPANLPVPPDHGSAKSFGQVLEATAALDERALTFGELGMFGMRQTVSPPPSAEARPPAASSTQSLPAQDPLRHDPLRMGATAAEADAQALSLPTAAGAKAASASGAQTSMSAMTPLDRTALAMGSEAAMPAILIPGDAPEVSPRLPGQIEIPATEPASSAPSGEPRTVGTQATETWLTLNITDTMASLAIRDMDPGASTSPSLKARIEDLFAEHGLSLHEFTLNGVTTPRAIKTGKEA